MFLKHLRTTLYKPSMIADTQIVIKSVVTGGSPFDIVKSCGKRERERENGHEGCIRHHGQRQEGRRK